MDGASRFLFLSSLARRQIATVHLKEIVEGEADDLLGCSSISRRLLFFRAIRELDTIGAGYGDLMIWIQCLDIHSDDVGTSGVRIVTPV